jgi:uncharacterized membrane protein
MGTKIAYNISLILHIAGGFLALIAGLLAMYSKKGGRTHKKAGRYFFGGMTATACSAVILSFIHPNMFLFMVAIFSYQLSSMGYRILRLKKIGNGQMKPEMVDWMITVIPTVAGFWFLISGIWQISSGQNFGWVKVVFGFLAIRFAFIFIMRFYRAPRNKMFWMFVHLQSFGGAYIATATAFLVVNVDVLPGLVLWLGPSFIGTFVIVYVSGKYVKRQKAGKAIP